MKKHLILFACVALLASCSSTPPRPVTQDIDTSAKINLDVLTVVVLDRSNSLFADTPYASNNFEPTIANAMRQWATEKLVATGATGEATVVIRDASLKSEVLRHPDSWFTREQASKYVGHAEIEIDITRLGKHGQITAEASRFETLPEDASTAERQNAYMKLLNAVMHDLGDNARAGIHDHLGDFIATAPNSAL